MLFLLGPALSSDRMRVRVDLSNSRISLSGQDAAPERGAPELEVFV